MSVVANNTANSTPAVEVMSVIDYVCASINFPIPEEAVVAACLRRGIDGSQSYEEAISEGVVIDLLRADVLKWIVLGASSIGTVSDKDNSWSHSDGGYTLSKNDKKLLMAEANSIYEQLEPDSVFKVSTIRFHSFGVGRAVCDLDGTPLPRIQK